MNRIALRAVLAFFLFMTVLFSFAQQHQERELLLIDDGWHFAFGHPNEVREDFGHTENYFSYLAKTGNGDGPAATLFDDRAWRLLDIPHDWAVEQDFSEKASFSHGFKPGKVFLRKVLAGTEKKSISRKLISEGLFPYDSMAYSGIPKCGSTGIF